MQENWLSNAEVPLTIAVVGMGKIGLPLAVRYAQQGHHVIGCDINAQVVETINAGQSHVHEEPELLTEVPRLVHEGNLSATQDTAAAVQQASVVVIIVPVFIDANHQIDFTMIDAASKAVGTGLRAGTLVIYETTLPVGTTVHRLAPMLEQQAQLQAGKDFFLAYSPERVSSGSIFRDLQRYPKVIGGITPASTAAAKIFYERVLQAITITMATTDEAEFVKLIETTYRDVNIALANEYARYADIHKLNVMAAIAAANTQPYSHIHTPGIGVGGHCIPVYPYFLFANPLDQPIDETTIRLARHARSINDAMAVYAVDCLEAILGPLAKQAVLILGIAYRGNVRETAFTSASLLRDALRKRGAMVYAHDPLFSDDELRQWGYTPFPAEQEEKIVALILQSDHKSYHTLDITRFGKCRVLLDGRHALSEERNSIEEAGIRYVAIGDGTFMRDQQNHSAGRAIVSVVG